MHDCIIRGGLVVDGSGKAAFQSDIGIRDGRIVAIGPHLRSARRTIDAGGLAVVPGFIDVHTHYDAQVQWDPALTPSSLHGVTTVIGGNCGFTLAPVSDDSVDYITRMLASVEGMPVTALQAALRFNWRTYGEWLDTLEGRLGINAGFLAGHSTIRRKVMGNDWRRAATDVEIDTMSVEVEQAIRAGALGFSSSWGGAHADHEGNPVPSRFATRDELVRISATLRPLSGTRLEFIPPTTATTFPPDTVALMADMSAAAGRSLNWNLLAVGLSGSPSDIWSRVGVFDLARERGGDVMALALPIPLQVRTNLRTTLTFNAIPPFREVLALPEAEKLRQLADPVVRNRIFDHMRREGHDKRLTMNFGEFTVDSVKTPRLRSLENRRIGDIAAERGVSSFDAFLDIALEDKLDTWFLTPEGGSDPESWRLRAQVWDDPRVLVGGSDAGAHLDSTNSFAFFTDFIGPSVRERGLISLEAAIHKITERPARYYGLRDRGRLATGNWADVVIFDPATVRTGKTSLRSDLPGGESRIFAESIGIDRVMVAGVDVYAQGRLTGALPGRVLRSGRDTVDS